MSHSDQRRDAMKSTGYNIPLTLLIKSCSLYNKLGMGRLAYHSMQVVIVVLDLTKLSVHRLNVGQAPRVRIPLDIPSSGNEYIEKSFRYY